MNDFGTLSTRALIFLAVASAIVTANAYYIHPIIGRVAESFTISAAMVGAVPALNQFALALGVLLLLPLGDHVSNRRLIAICLGAQVVALLVMATVHSYLLFVLASTLLGFFTVTPYLLPAYASKRVDASRLGFATAVLTTGVVAGVQLSRLTSGVIAEHLGWRTVYLLAAGLMAMAAVGLPALMSSEQTLPRGKRQPYGQLLRSTLGLIGTHGAVLNSGIIQGLNFAIFLAMWMGIGLHVTGPAMNLGTDVVGYLAASAVVALFTTPGLGRWADRRGAEPARLIFSLLHFAAVASLSLGSRHWQLLVIPVLGAALVSPLIDVTGRMTSLRGDPAMRSRLMTLYITLMFLGAGLGSWGGTIAYDVLGWWGTVGLCTTLSALLCALAYRETRRSESPAL